MMDRETLVTTMGERDLTIGEILSHAYALLSNRFGNYLLLSFMVFLPANLILSFLTERVDLSLLLVENADMTGFSHALFRTLSANLLASLISIIALLVVAVTVKNQLFDEENYGFSTCFYRGIRMWIRAVVTFALLIFSMVGISLLIGFMMIMPLIGLAALALIFVVAISFVMYQNLALSCVALRGRLGFDCIRYVGLLLHGKYFKVLLKFLLVSLITYGITAVVSLFTGNLFAFSSDPLVIKIVETAISTVLGILDVFGFLCGALIFLNLEEIVRVRLEKIHSPQPEEDIR